MRSVPTRRCWRRAGRQWFASTGADGLQNRPILPGFAGICGAWVDKIGGTLLRLPTPNFRAGRDCGGPRSIVVHTTVGTFEGTAAWFASIESGVSSHYLVGLDGRVAQFVDEADTARHAGKVVRPTIDLTGREDPNDWTVGIELEDGGDPHKVVRTAEQLGATAELLRGIAWRWEIPLDRQHVFAHREIRSDKTCPGNVDVEALIAAAQTQRVVCLLPVRNGERELEDWLASAARVADAVVALDDGSTDGTRAMLEAHPLVVRVLGNPVRETYAGWDDGANRNRLLEAALELAPDWVLSLDADERIPRDDAEALRAFLAADALPGVAYGLRHLRVWADGHDPTAHVVYRLFAPRPGDSLPTERLHFTPIPRRIPLGARVPTTIRLQHLSAADPPAVAARVAKYREADPDGNWRNSYANLVAPPMQIVSGWPPRPRDLPVLDPNPPAEADDQARAPRLVCLLAVRNGAEDLPGYLESVARFADAVVALDDGSTDATRVILEEHPLVARVLSNPRRESYAGWDDAENRNRLLEAAAELEPAWLLVLDADERVDPDDALALRRFVDTTADPERAYGMRVYRMIDGLDRYDAAELWAYRLFAHRPGDRFPEDRLHYVPVPTRVPREAWTRTTIRIQHLASLTAERRRARFAKYAEADAEREFQADYGNLLVEPEPGTLRRWAPRPPDLPVLAPAGSPGVDVLDLHRLDLEGPVLSAIIISRNDEDRIERTVRSVVTQEVPAPFEVIVVVSGTDRTANIVRERFPQVRLVVLEGEALPGRARNAGVRIARGDFVSFPGSHTELPPGSLAARLAAHEQGHAMITGSMHNGTHTAAGWASYFLDHSQSLPGRPSGSLRGPPAHCSYSRDLVLAVGAFPEDMRAGEDTVVNRELWRRGHGAYRAREVALFHHSRCTTPERLVRHHFGRGRALGRIMLDDHACGGPLLNRRVVTRIGRDYVRDRLRRTAEGVARWGSPDERRIFDSVHRLVVAGVVAAWAGTWHEILRPRRGKLRILVRDTRPPAS